jgi:uncharacterized membrane protein YdbT with pleckstrin-like domain
MNKYSMDDYNGLAGPRNLDSRIKLRWFAGWAVFLVPLLVAIYISAYMVLPEYGFAFAVHYETLLIFFTVVLIISLFLKDELKYRRYVYSMNSTELIIEKGIVEKIRYIIPYEKIQNVTVSRDLPDRILGLCTLHIETAAHYSGGRRMLLPGIADDIGLDKTILSLSKAAREHKVDGAEESEKSILESILRELTGIRRALEKAEEPADRKVMIERLRGRTPR